jgi:sirohydrochlorin ferrochelatase
MKTAIIIVDHGSRSADSNALLVEVARQFHRRFGDVFEIVEPAHMEIAEPSIARAYAKCVERGAGNIMVCPFFLGPGKHWQSDIPRLVLEANQQFPETISQVTAPLGVDTLILDLLAKRIAQSLYPGAAEPTAVLSI